MQPTWRRHTAAFDPDSITFLTIIQRFLVEYFGHSEATAEQLLDRSMADGAWGEDDYHQEGAYRSAAMIHYLHTFSDRTGGMLQWLIENGHNNAPEAARAYFNSHYYTAPHRDEDDPADPTA